MRLKLTDCERERERKRETEKAQAGGRSVKERETQSEAGPRLQAVSTEPDAGLELMNCEIMT